MGLYLVVHRLLCDSEIGIPIEAMHPEKPDWRTIGIQNEPPPGVKPSPTEAKG